MTNAEEVSKNILRRGSFSEEEAFFLKQLLLDDHATVNADEIGEEPKRVLDDEVLLSVPPLLDDSLLPPIPPVGTAKLPSSHQKAQRRSIKGLWEAHASGVNPKSLKQHGSLPLRRSSVSEAAAKLVQTESEEAARQAVADHLLRVNSNSPLNNDDVGEVGDDDDDGSDTRSDQEVRPEKDPDIISVASSWDEEDDKMFDAWEVLKDEYAVDFGFDYSTENVTIEDILSDDDVGNTFKILGTSADDVHSHPHVLSPPLMDALSNFLPADVQGQNFWMRFSLVRDGSSLSTLKEYVRAAQYTILAIETPDGQVFGSFTSSIWRNHLGFYGGPPAFVWKMRHSRRTKCVSLFDQAQLESEIDIFNCIDKDQLVQACRHDSLSMGGDDGPLLKNGRTDSTNIDQDGFAIAIEEDLMVGTTSPSRTFKNPALCGNGDKTNIFNVAGLEVWSFTPCMDVKSAQRLEMTKYFIEESSRHASTHSAGDSTVDSFGSRDLVQEKFYRRVGDDLESEERRQRWQYANMMNGDSTCGPRGFGASPRFLS